MAQPEKRSITIREVADLAKVSIKTVSRVINREAGVSHETHARVMDAIARLDYRPNLNARGLAGDRSFLIGLFYDNPSAHYMSDVQAGAVARCREGGFHLLVEPWDSTDPTVGDQVLNLISQLRLEGVILTPPLVDHAGVLEALRTSRIPLVRIAPDTDRETAPFVYMDDYAASRQMTAYLISLGHRRIGFLLGHPDHGATEQRYRGFRDELAEHRIPLDPELVRPGHFSYRIGMACAEQLLTLADRPTAIFASNDDMAAASVAVAQRLGLSVPADLSVAGFDDTPVARIIWPQLTTIRQPISRMAAAAADLLIDRAVRRQPWTHPMPRRLLEFEVVVRESTAPPSSVPSLGRARR
ncbi:LacI family transcriptional regulator [Nitrospirillum amazonense]|uniref:LacI family transcriptional regulator n=1 Tax=Nitrospirillum amazonense TaxID=28077 RepID=A0A560FC02_9PROT|nr:LacI family DNA-binding transcriptional regulator [Nitrospirillum amazonense]TWB19085.1 LacI family transcriptional regulator [Nitrospirillum amazonense]